MRSGTDAEGNPFARANNVGFSGRPWTRGTSHGDRRLGLLTQANSTC